MNRGREGLWVNRVLGVNKVHLADRVNLDLWVHKVHPVSRVNLVVGVIQVDPGRGQPR